MKRNRKGEIRLGKNEYRCGNFIVTAERYRVSVTDVSARVKWSIPVTNPSGWLLNEAVRRKADEYITAYTTVIFTLLQTPPDGTFLRSIADICTSHIEAHPEYLGKEHPTDDKAADDEIIKEEEQMQKEMEA